jgi:hypothetical protein
MAVSSFHDLPLAEVRFHIRTDSPVNANDSSEAGLAARTAIDDAVREAGLSEDAVAVDAPEIRGSS